MLERLYHMLVKEFIQVLRNPRMRAVIFIVPVVQVLIIGYAVNTDVRHVPLAVYDLDRTPSSRDLITRFEGSGCFDVVRRLSSEQEIQAVLDSGVAKAVLRFNRGFSEDLKGGRTASVQLLLDGSDSNTASVVLSDASHIAADFNRAMLQERFARTMGLRLEAEPVTLVSRAWFNPNLDSRNFFVPGVLAMLVAVVSIILSAMAIVREREIGTMEQIMVTPIRSYELILGKLIPFTIVGMVNVCVVITVMVFGFGIPVQGSVFLLFVLTGAFLMTSLGVGLFVSTISRTQQQAMMTAIFFVMMPMMYISGFVFPIENMPAPLQYLSLGIPMRYYLIIIRSIILKGVGISTLWPQAVMLVLMGSAILVASALRFRKKLD